MKITNTILMTLSLTAMTASLYAADFQLQNIRTGGVGCPSETTSITLAPDSSAASIIFQQFESRVPVLDAGPKVQKSISTLNCNIFLDIKIPAGIKLDSIDVSYDMRGFATLDAGVQGSFKSWLVSKSGLGTEVGGRGPELLIEKNWANSRDSQEEDFTITAAKSIPTSSQCGTTSGLNIVSVRLQTTLASLILKGFENSSTGSITMDSSDVKGGLKLRAATSACRAAPPVNGGRNCRIVKVNGRTQQVCN